MRKSLFVLAIAVAASATFGSIATAAQARTIDLKVLVVSSGTADEDPGLNLMDDVLDEVGVPYDVLDSRRETLTPDRLGSADHGRYNGVIVTNSELYYWDSNLNSGQTGFNAAEWQALHDYERDFGVRESVVSGFPSTNPSLGLDYGMTDVGAGSNFLADWAPPAGGNEYFEYVNNSRSLEVTDFAFHGRPVKVFTAEPRDDGTGPDVEPLLVLHDDHSKALVSVLRYPDGRQVMLSTVSNAWFLAHSQVLAYEFVKFATKGQFIGGRHVYLSAQNDDLFLADSLWNPASNLTVEGNDWRMSGADYDNAIAAQNALRAAHPTASDFKVDLAFNGAGADTRILTEPPATLTSVADTFLRQRDPTRNFGNANSAAVRFRSGAQDAERALLRFNLPVSNEIPVTQATLKLYASNAPAAGLPVQVCRVTAAWDEGTGRASADANWHQRQTGALWTGPGGDFDASSCVPSTLRANQTASIDVTQIAADWRRGAPNNGLVVVTSSSAAGQIKTREDGNASRRPALSVSFGSALAASVADPTKPLQLPDLTLGSAGDTFIRQSGPTKNFGTDPVAEVQLRSGNEQHALLNFDIRGGSLPTFSQATLNLHTEGANRIPASVCPATAQWDEGTKKDGLDATWQQRKTGVAWASAGGDYDATRCADFTFANGASVPVDVTSIVEDWNAGEIPNYGLVVVSRTAGWGRIRTREEGNAAKRPTLRVTFQSVVPDSLTAAVVRNPGAFRFLNHTFSHRDMDVSAGTNYDQAKFQIQQNQAVWSLLGLPGKAENDSVMISGDHSGLRDDMGTDLDPSDDVTYPQGKNDAFLRAAQDAGIRYLASDSSQPNQNVEALVPGFDVLLLPRYPTAVFYNTTTPQELTDEYNYIFHERYLNQGQNPCSVPAAICAPRTYEQILSAEADTAVRHMLAYKPWSHYFHQSNLRNYDGNGRTLQFDWLNSVLSRYEAVFDLPIVNATYREIAQNTEDRLAARRANVRGVIDLETGQATITADSAAQTYVTGIAGGDNYGGESIRSVSVGTTAQTFTVDRALDR